MSQFTPGRFATAKQKECASKTGYRFVEPMIDPFGTNTNTEKVRNDYKNCVEKSNEMNQTEKLFTPEKIVFGIAILIIGAICIKLFR